MGMHDIQRPRARASALTTALLGALLALGLAWAQPADPPAAVGLLIVDGAGAIVGVGELGPDAAVLELTVEVDGIMGLVLVAPSGAPALEAEMFVGANGGLVVTRDAGFEALEVFAERYTPSLLDVRRLESLVAEQAADRWEASGLWLDRSLLPDVAPSDRVAAALAQGPFDDAFKADAAALEEALEEPLDEPLDAGEEARTGVAEEVREDGREFGMHRRDEALERAPGHAGEPGNDPDVGGPPMEAPPVEVPPVEAPPVEAPPVEAPPVEAPPVEAPPVEAPPVEVPVDPPNGRPADPKDPVADPPPFGPPIVIDPPVEPVPLEPLPNETPPVEAPHGDDDTSDDDEGATSGS